jgi:Tripartite tricarboxylate transporter TctB family
MTPVRLGAVFALICALAVWQLGDIGQSAIQMTVGPAGVPRAIVALFALMVVVYTVSAWRGHQVDESEEPDQSALPGGGLRLVSLFSGGLVFMAGVTWLGFVVPAAACGMLVARAFDAPFSGKSAVVCSGIAIVLWVLFAKVLGVGLGPATPFGF